MQRWLLVCLLVVASSGFFASTSAAYPNSDSCLNCHTDFLDSGSTHSQHQDVLGCRDCHVNIGDTPATNSSGNHPDYSCNGCHVLGGIVNFHINNEASGCGCHAGISAPASEAILPFFYTNDRSGIVNPCRTNAANGGEDLDGDGFGLDNDADGLYDAADSDCDNIVPLDQRTWSNLKDLFELD